MERILKILSAGFFLAIAIGACHENADDSSTSFVATDYYWYGEEKILLQKIDGKFYIEFYSVDENKIREECTKKSITIYDVQAIRDWASFVDEGAEGSGAKIFTDLMVGFIEGSYKQCVEVLSSTLYWSPFYKYESGELLKVSSKFTVILKFDTTLKQIEELAIDNAVEMIGIDKHDSNWYHLACTNHSKGNALKMANLFYDSGLFETAWPNCISGSLSGSISLNNKKSIISKNQ